MSTRQKFNSVPICASGNVPIVHVAGEFTNAPSGEIAELHVLAEDGSLIELIPAEQLYWLVHAALTRLDKSESEADKKQP